MILIQEFDNPLVLVFKRRHRDLLYLMPAYKENGGLFYPETTI